MLTGKPPFKGAHQPATFQKIQKRELDFPEDLDPAAKDLIDKILQVDPYKRICGRGDRAGYARMKQHPFFEGIDWDTLSVTNPPPLPEAPPPPSPSQTPSSSQNFNYESPSPVKRHGSTGGSKSPSSIWSTFLEDGEEIVLCGAVLKSNPINPIPSKRQLILTSQCRLIYVDPNIMKIKGYIPSDSIVVKAKDARVFWLYTPKRRYTITSKSTSAYSWINAIEGLQKEKKQDQA